jgi:anti-sigma regulatory factor (Ser/Thr protein kinase)
VSVARHADAGGFVHEALLYAGLEEFVRGALSFIRAGLEADEPVLVVVDSDKIRALRAELNGDGDRVHFADMAEVGVNPARIIPAWRDFVDAHAVDGRAVRGIGEPIWAARSADELVECQLHESLLNLAFADAPAFRLLCPYDTDSLDDAVIAEALCSHPTVVEGEDRRPSAAYRGLEAIAAPFDEPLLDPPSAPHELVFGSDSLAAARQLVYVRATSAGLSLSRMHDLALAVNEVATNSILHGGGEGVLRIWEHGDALICEVRDAGRMNRPLVGRERPDDGLDRGRGLWIANQLCELVQVRTFADGTAVRMHMRTC